MRQGNLDPDDFWMSEEASDDSLRAYWNRIARVWEDEAGEIARRLVERAATAERPELALGVADRLGPPASQNILLENW